MPIYFLLGKLTPQGQHALSENPDKVLETAQNFHTPGASIMAQYAVLGHYDHITMIEADSNDAVARLSAEFGARTGLRFETLTALKQAFMREPTARDDAALEETLQLQTPTPEPVPDPFSDFR